MILLKTKKQVFIYYTMFNELNEKKSQKQKINSTTQNNCAAVH